MKINSFILLASFAVFATNANAAQNQLDAEIVILPAYEVRAPRLQPFEQYINASLNELRQQAQTPLVVTPASIPLKKQVDQRSGFAHAAQEGTALRVAKA